MGPLRPSCTAAKLNASMAAQAPAESSDPAGNLSGARFRLETYAYLLWHFFFFFGTQLNRGSAEAFTLPWNTALLNEVAGRQDKQAVLQAFDCYSAVGYWLHKYLDGRLRWLR